MARPATEQLHSWHTILPPFHSWRRSPSPRRQLLLPPAGTVGPPRALAVLQALALALFDLQPAAPDENPVHHAVPAPAARSPAFVHTPPKPGSRYSTQER